MSRRAEDRVRGRVLARLAPTWLSLALAAAVLLWLTYSQIEHGRERERILDRITAIQRGDCERGNELRAALRGVFVRVVASGRPLSPRAEAFYRDWIRSLAAIDCAARIPLRGENP